MVVPANVLPIQELRTADGQVFAVVLSPAEFARMQAEAQALRAERDRLAARVEDMLRRWVPGPMSAEEIVAAEQSAGEFSAFIVEAKVEGERGA